MRWRPQGRRPMARLEAAKAEERAAQARATRRRSGVAARLALLLLLLLLVATAVVAPPVALLPLLQLPPDWPAPLLRHSLPAGWLAALPTGWSGDEEGRGGTAWRPPWWSWSATGPSRLVLRSAVDGQCLQLMSERPRLRFGPCNGAHADDAHAFASFDGTLTSSDFSTKLYLPPPLPPATLAATAPAPTTACRRRPRRPRFASIGAASAASREATPTPFGSSSALSAVMSPLPCRQRRPPLEC